MDPVEIAAAAASLREVIASVESGEIDADEAQRAYLIGAADALDGIIVNL